MILLVASLFGFYGIISNDTTWSDTACLTGDVLVQPGVTLTIAPGTIVLYSDTCEWDTSWYKEGEEYPETDKWNMDLIVEGNLKAIGTITDSVHFCSFEGNRYSLGTLVMVSGYDSLEYCYIANFAHLGVSRIYVQDVELTILNSKIEACSGISGIRSQIILRQDEFTNNMDRLVELEGGNLLVDSCVVYNSRNIKTDLGWRHWIGGIITVKDLDYCTVKSSIFRLANGYSQQGASGSDCVGCYFITCHDIELVGCIFDSIFGGQGGYPGSGTDAPGCDGGDGYAIYLTACDSVIIDKNIFCRIQGGFGGPGSNGIDGSPGSTIILRIENSNPLVVNNEFINPWGTFIQIDSNSQPVIGGEREIGNRFCGFGLSQGCTRVIYNDSPSDINATWNFWECSPSMIDSLIYDYYDDPQKGIVYYDNYQGVEEGEEVLLEPFTLRSSIVHDMLTVSFASGLKNPVTLELFDINGCRVRAVTVQGPQFSLDVSDLARGAYFIAVPKSAGQKLVRKVIIY